MPCTGRLTAMFSELASTKPTAPTLFSKPAVGGEEGGATVACTGWDRTIAKIANVRMRAAMMGTPYLVMIEVLLALNSRSQPKGLPAALPFLRSGRRPYGRCGRQNQRRGYHASRQSRRDLPARQ